MITLLLVTVLAQEPAPLQHATPLEFSILPDDPVLEGVGPSKTFRYEIGADEVTLYVFAESPSTDLALSMTIKGAKRLRSGLAGGSTHD